MAFLSVFFFSVWGKYCACAAELTTHVNTTRAACLILMCMGYVFSLLFLSESATRGISEITKQFQPNWKKKQFSVLFLDLSSSGSALFLNGAAMVLGVDARMSILVQVQIPAFFFFFFLPLSSFSWYFRGYRINYSWVPWGYGSCFSVSTAFSAPTGFTVSLAVALPNALVCPCGEKAFLLGRETGVRLLPWLKSWYCDTFRCS